MRVTAFYIISTLASIFALLSVTRRNAVHSAVMLVVTLLLLAVDYLLLGSLFIALSQVFVYAGAIVVLFLFVIMLLGSSSEEDAKRARRGYVWGIITGLIFILIAGAKLSLSSNLNLRISEVSIENVAANLVGSASMFGEHSFAFELGSVLVLSALIGAFLLSTRRGHSDTLTRSERNKQ